jgi:Lon protease-like protein
MTNFISIFPLAIVVYPGEELNLHIFEPRYKQLINDCVAQKKPFGIPAVVNNKQMELGTLVEVKEVVKRYDTGEMDIKTRGINIFEILETIQEIPEKLYQGAIVTHLSNIENGKSALMLKIIELIREMHIFLGVNKTFKKSDELLNSFDVAHHLGLSLSEEYELLGLTYELQRQEYLRRHLTRVMTVLHEMDQLKEKIKLNGHFKNLSGFDQDFKISG